MFNQLIEITKKHVFFFLNNLKSTRHYNHKTHMLASLATREKKKNLSSDERQAIISSLLLKVKDEGGARKLERGAINAAAEAFHVHRNTIRAIWDRARANFDNHMVVSFVSESRKKTTCGRKIKWNREDMKNAVKELPLHQRRSIRDLAVGLAIPKSTVWHIMRLEPREKKIQSIILPVTIAFKPKLTDVHKVARVLYCCDFVDPEEETYHPFFDHVHIDEKWFFVTEKSLRVYLAADEEIPELDTINKDHITKVMFLCAIARPRFDENGQCIFDGKIGMWPFVERVEAQRTTVNRPRGTMLTRPVNCTKVRYRRMLVDHVLPAIKRVWPNRREGIRTCVTIQQDGASSHIDDNDEEFTVHARNQLWKIHLLIQPAKSPDLNVLDLSFFRSLQSEQWRSGVENTVDGLIRQVLAAFQRFEPRKIDFGFLSLMQCMDNILKIHGGNHYRMSHMGKEVLLRAGELPLRLSVSDESIEAYNVMMAAPPEDSDSDDSDDDEERRMIQQGGIVGV